ncbi:hypothetical protein HYH03_005046 [Edaphochlamys debaryana]|uniref:Protein FAM91A1 n=1 Tax=Edaphochlamys debaryana TaxID=47281 RepID=A0A835YA50_9CHLO|nr:hypothetical protein HYH03_005046 [Edaphochlamys debaryana]|eukprot:KAG2497046.1 hypothetical protein HYH03_005046 [Edaphochlamys debaryana]
MASQELVLRAIASGRVYEDLPPRMQNLITPYEWRTKVREYCVQRGLPWSASLACTVCGQQEYYDELVKAYRGWMRLFPYHLSDYLCRVARLTPYKYYSDMLTAVLKDEKSYDRVPNFTAADALLVLGIGRNEYIAALNACKARRLLWRVGFNREAIAREQLPAEPLPQSRLEPWWRVGVVNIGEAEYRELGEEELAHLKTAALPSHAGGSDIRVRDLQPSVLRGLLRKGLAYLEIPIEQDDRFSIPPLEGFVSNKTADAGDAAADPVESLLYSVFVANSERMTVAQLAGILGVELAELQAALAVACRLGFATRVTDTMMLPPPHVASTGSDLLLSGGEDLPTGSMDGTGSGTGYDDDPLRPGGAAAALGLAAGLIGGGRGGGGVAGGAVAVVLDAEATGYLMMGALSPGLKRHSVTLFEGGRVAGEEVMRELVQELRASAAAGAGFEGDLRRLTAYAEALAGVLEAVRASAGPGVPLELLRKESLAGLSQAAACRVLHHAYCAVVPIAPLPPPVLPLSPHAPGPAYYGPSLEAASPWLSLALYSAARSGPESLVFVCGQRLWRLPHPLDRCSHALLSPWDEDGDPGRVRPAGPDSQCTLVEASFLLYTLNALLARTAVMVQPLDCNASAAATSAAANATSAAGGGGGGGGGGAGAAAQGPASPAAAPPPAGAGVAAEVVDVPLPLLLPPLPAAVEDEGAAGAKPGEGEAPLVVTAVHRPSGESRPVALPPSLVAALRSMGLASCVGHVRLMRLGGGGGGVASGGGGAGGGGSQAPETAAEVPGPELTAAVSTSGSGSGVGSGIGSGAAGSDGGAGPGAAGSGALAAAAGGAAADAGGPWVPLRVQLGLPLYSLDLCRRVCGAAEAAGFLTPEGRRNQHQVQAQLQSHLTRLVHLYCHPSQDGAYGSEPPPSAAGGDASAATAAADPPSGGPAAAGPTGGGGGGNGGAPAAALPPLPHVGSVLPLPAVNLSFDGRSLQPVRLADSLQGLGCLCQR